MELQFLEAVRPMPLIELPLRTAYIALGSGSVLWSPASTLDVETLRSVGPVTDLVAPNLFHLDGIPGAVAAHPEARVWGPPGAADKLPGPAWKVLGVDPWPHAAELPLLPIEGMPTFAEVVFLHPATRTLLVTDLAFNMKDASGLGAWLILNLFGTWKRFAVSRLFLRRVQDRAAFQASLERLLALDFDRLVPSHGEVVPTGAQPLLRAALRERGFEV